MKEHRSPAVVLRHLDYGEADRIVTCFTRDQGLLKGFARSARRSRRRFGPALEPFASIVLHWTAPAGEGLVRLREAELLDLRTHLRTDLALLGLASYACELTEQLFAQPDPHSEVCDLLNAFLDHLSTGGPPQAVRLLFELRLLATAGYAPHFLHCSQCGAHGEARAVAFSAEQGGRLCRDCAGSGCLQVSPLTLGTLARCLRTPQTLFAGFRFSEQTLREAEAVLQDALRPHLVRPVHALRFMARFGNAANPGESR